MRILSCPPDHFDVDYVINPWMEDQIGRVDHDRARAQWQALFEDLARVVAVDQVAPEPGLPDMCFTANAGLVDGERCVPARFRMRERRGEEARFSEWFTRAGFGVEPLADADPFEGEGDALFQPGRPLLWAGYGVRTALETHRPLAETFGVEVVSLRLVDQRFYHLDTCFAPLPEDRLLYYPAAFDARSNATIEARVPAEQRIAVSDADARAFACNALRVDDRIFLNAASDALVAALAAWGFEARQHPVDEFLKAGGAVKCLTLQLEQPAFARTAPPSSTIRAADVTLAGHLLDAGLLRRALDHISDGSGSFRVDALDLAERKDQPSRVDLRVVAPDAPHLDRILAGLEQIGAEVVSAESARG